MPAPDCSATLATPSGPEVEPRELRILTLTSLFPNASDRAHGIFVLRRMAAVAAIPRTEVQVIAPVPFVPGWVKTSRAKQFARVPRKERIGDLEVFHPRYALVPKISMPMHGVLMYLGVRHTALRLHAEKPFDCIDAHYVYPDGFAAALLGRLLDIPVTISARGTDINTFPSFRSIRPMIRWALHQSSGIISVSNALKQRMVELGATDERIRVIGNGVDTELFRVIDRRQARKSLGIPDEGRVIVSVASLRPRKGHQHILGAFASVCDSYPDLRLYFLGEGPERNAIEQTITSLGLDGRVLLVGNRSNEEIALWFNAADLSVLASFQEGWPNVVLESLACGTPVVATAAGQVPEILSSDELGIIAEQNSDSLASAMQRVLDRICNREALSRYAHGRPWENVAQEVRQYLESTRDKYPEQR